MKKLVLTSFVVALLSFSSFSQMKKIPIPSKELEADITFVTTVQVKTVTKKEIAANKVWLIISTSYKTEKELISKSSKSVKWIDGMKMKYEVILPITYNGKDIHSLLTGEVEYWAVPKDGETHKAVAFIPPQVLERYRRDKIKKNKNYKDKIYARITFYDNAQKLIGVKYIHPRRSNPKKTQEIFKKATSTVTSGILKIENVVLGRNKTPWGNINSDMYEFIKIDGNK